MIKHLLAILFLGITPMLYGQTLSGSLTDSLKTIPASYPQQLYSKADKINKKLKKQIEKSVRQMSRMEERVRQKIEKVDPEKAKQIFADKQQQYKALEERLQHPANSTYVPSLDSMLTSLKFLNQHPWLLAEGKQVNDKLNKAISNVNELNSQLKTAEEVRQFIKERTGLLNRQLNGSGFAKQLKPLNKHAYYYSEQLNSYKELLKDHKKAERKVLDLLCETRLFRDFMKKNSMLSSLFRLPGAPDDPFAQANLSGLQTRAQVNNVLQQQIGAGGPNSQAQFYQSFQNAKGRMDELKKKINSLGGGSSNRELPQNFKPNNQKTKSFLERLEYGINVQSQKPNRFFPVTSDLAVSAGYKINDKSVIGIGASYKMGWGDNIRHINISSEGVGLRSYFDIKLKGSFWLSGGYEMNYQTAFNRIRELKEFNAWQSSGLAGISKVVSLKTKFFKKTKLMFLWDFLSYQQVPRGQPIIFRIGYQVK